MAVWDKAAYTASYSICPRGVYQYPDGHTEPRRFTEIRLHYHPAVIKPIVSDRLDKILAVYSIAPTDRVLVFGSGFGWLCEELESRIGCSSMGIDPSPYIIDNKDLSPDDELLESLTAKGLNPSSGMGKQIFDQFSQPGVPRTTANVVAYDLTKKGDRNALIRDFGTPTHIITEEVWQTLTIEEQTAIDAEFQKLGSQVIHVIDGIVI